MGWRVLPGAAVDQMPAFSRVGDEHDLGAQDGMGRDEPQAVNQLPSHTAPTPDVGAVFTSTNPKQRERIGQERTEVGRDRPRGTQELHQQTGQPWAGDLGKWRTHPKPGVGVE